MDFMKKTLSQVNTQENTLYDFIYNLVFFAALQESEDDIKNGRVMTIEESKERMRKKYASFDVKWDTWRYTGSIFEYISRDSIKYANETSENIYSRIYYSCADIWFCPDDNWDCNRKKDRIQSEYGL